MMGYNKHNMVTYQVNAVSVEQMTQGQVVHLMRSLPPGPVVLQVSRQETRLSNDDTISVLEVINSYDHVIYIVIP